MPRLTLKELLAVTATDIQKFNTLRKRDQIGLAFGRGIAPASLSYLPVDAVGMLIVETLGKSYPRLEVAAQLTRLHFDAWGRCVAEADANPDCQASFVIVDLEREHDGAQAHFVAGTADVVQPELLAADLVRSTPQTRGFTATRITCINVSRLMRFIRAQATAVGIDLSHSFMPPPDSREFAELMRPYTDRRDAAIIEARNRRNREALADRLGDKARAAFEQLDAMTRDREMVS